MSSVRVGQVLIGKPEFGGGHYIQIGVPRDKEGNAILKNSAQFPLQLQEGQRLYLNDPRAELDYMVEQGKIPAGEAEQRKAKIPDFIKYNVNLSIKGQ